jgi:hypothetical protein
MFDKILLFISLYFTITYKMPTKQELTDSLLKGCSLVVVFSKEIALSFILTKCLKLFLFQRRQTR